MRDKAKSQSSLLTPYSHEYCKEHRGRIVKQIWLLKYISENIFCQKHAILDHYWSYTLHWNKIVHPPMMNYTLSWASSSHIFYHREDTWWYARRWSHCKSPCCSKKQKKNMSSAANIHNFIFFNASLMYLNMMYLHALLQEFPWEG